MTTFIKNRKARFDYEILETFEAGVSLFGHEVKAIRTGKAKLEGAFVKLYDGQAVLLSATISPYQAANTPDSYQSDRARQLLFRRKELARFTRELHASRLTLVPLSFYNKGGKIKLQVALARGKKKADKRESLKLRDTKRDLAREVKSHR